MELVSELIRNVRICIQDRDMGLWDDTEILQAADRVLGPIWSSLALSGQDHGLDREVFTVPSAGTGGIANSSELILPGYIGRVRFIEGVGSEQDEGEPIPLAELEAGRRSGQRFPTYSYSQGAGPGRILINGASSATPMIRVWFLRRLPKLHGGIAQGGTTTSIVLDTTSGRFGDLDREAGFYARSVLRVTTDTSNPSNVGQQRTVSAWDGTTATLESALPATPTAGVTTYEMVVPLEGEFLNYLEWKVSEELVSRGWSEQAFRAVAMRLPMLENRFRATLRERTSRAPKYINRNARM